MSIEQSLQAWENFYVILGSSAAGLTGLTFVVIALAADAHIARLSGLRAFVMPTMLHFGSVLLIAALMSVPGHTQLTFAFSIGALGLLGTLYAGITDYRMLLMHRVATDYTPVFSDWLWNGILPLVSYVALAGSGLWALHHAAQATYGVGTVTLMLLFIGIHNAWDIAIWITVERPGVQTPAPEPAGPPPPTATEPARSDPTA